ncbi:Ger(x)C family spore germination protein [Halalkalibacter krulwichiae]|uniref:Spore germination protein B3 n=1 Tax=Halalkalibacter krulwichiae TaxID=199441 RepID=A0A1X9MBZ2_9BACI|nr:Ger(x)C family spore germination protein [Halalkalibacter krulwichiae]ARK30926.1 Spore germination protein B3 precursor [Halalkalibacter krulwichiae]
MAKACFSFLLLLLIVCLSGCWDYSDIERRANVLGISFDIASVEEVEKESEITHENKQDITFPHESAVRLTVQIAKPGSLPLGSAGEGGVTGKDTVKVIKVTGRTISDAWENLEQQVSLPLFMGHLRVLVVSDALAKAGLERFGDFWRRNPEIRRTAWMIVAEGTADKYMELEPELGRIPALYLVAVIDEAIKIGKFPEEYMGIAWTKYVSLGQEPILPFVTIKENGNIEISGLAYFRDGKLIGTTKALEIGRYMAIMGINPGGYSVLLPFKEEDATIMFKSIKRKSRFRTEIVNGKPKILINTHVDGEIEEVLTMDFTLTSESIREIEDALSQNAKESFMNLIAQTQKNQSDIFGFGEHFRAKHRQYWNQHVKTKEKWGEIYQDLGVELKVTASIKRIGMKNK